MVWREGYGKLMPKGTRISFQMHYNAIGKVMLYLSTVLSVWSVAVYFRGFLQMLSKREGAAA